jgi:chromosomal replication initiator protein
MAEITAEVAAMHGFSLEILRSHSRQKAVCHARQEAMWRCYRETGHGTTAVARFFRRDHTTVVHAVQKIERMQKRGNGNG